MAKFTREISAMEVRATEENLIRYSSKHVQHLPPGTITEYYWKNYSPMGFRLIQEVEDIDHVDYMHAICNNEIIDKLYLGKIGHVFHISTDDRFLIKILRKSEIKVTLEMLPSFYKHLYNYRTSLFTRIYGVHAVQPIGGAKIYFAVMSSMLHPKVFMNKLYDLKGSLKGRTDKKIELRNTPILKDSDLDFRFYVDPVTRQRIIKQTTLDCEFLEEEGIMDYSLLLGLQVKDSSQGSVDELNPAYGSFTPPSSFISDSSKSTRTTSIDSVESENSMTTTESVTRNNNNNNNTSSDTNHMNIKNKLDTLSDDDFILKRSITNFGMKIPARARRVKGEKEEEEWCDVVVYLGIVDTFQNYGMKKRIEHCYKSIQYNSKEISTVNPKIYSSRFQDLVSNIFLPHHHHHLSLSP